MTLREKAAAVVMTTIAALTCCCYWYGRSYLYAGYENQEKQEVYQNVERTLSVFAGEFREVSAVCQENGQREDAYEFAGGGNPQFADKALPIEILERTRLEFLIYFDLHGTNLAARFTKDHVTNAADQRILERQLVHTAGLMRAHGSAHVLLGVINFPPSPMLIAAAPVLPADGKGPARGGLMCGRRLDDNELALLSKSTGVSMSAFASRTSAPTDVQKVELDLPVRSQAGNSGESEARAESIALANVPVLVRPLDDQTIAGYFRLFDLEGLPVAMVRTMESRPIHKEAKSVLAVFMGGSIVGGIIFGFVVLTLLDRAVLAPIIRLSEAASTSDKGSDLTGNFQAMGDDELGVLSRAIQKSLDSVKISTESQRVAQDALRSAKEYAEKLIQTANAIVLGLDDNQRIFTWNEIAEKVTGYSAAEIRKRDWMQLLIPSEKIPMVRREMERLRQVGQPTSFESLIVTKSGARRMIAWQNNVLRVQDRVAGTISFGIDISERKNMEEELSRSERAYRSLVEGAPYGIFRLAPNNKLLLANPALAKMLGYKSATELLMASHTSLPFADSEICKELLQDGLHAIVSAEAIWKRKDGKEISVRLTGRAVQDETGKSSYCEIFSEDVTDQQRLQEQFFQSQKMEAVGRLAGGVAHDFNNLLGVIIGYSELVLDHSNLEDRLKSKIEQIKKSGQRAAALTGQLLAYSRKQILQLRVVNLNSSITDAQKMLNRLIGEDVELVTILDPDLAAVKADPTQLDQILLNLAVNARDAMPQGGKLTIRTDNFSVHEPLEFNDFEIAPNRYVVLTVSDTGSGMDSETQARIFEPFFTTKGQGKGTGLGLATVYGIVKQSSGYVICESQIGKGTLFRIFFPRVEQAVQETASQGPQTPLPRGTETVLVAEDAESLRSLIRDFLTQLGYTVLEAANGSQALYVAQTHPRPIELLLTDVVMPGIGGRELAEKFKAVRPEAAVLYMSGYTDDTIMRHGIEEGGVALLTKPFTMDTIAQKIREVLSTSLVSSSQE